MKIHRTPKAAAAALAIGSMLFTACSAEESSNPTTEVSAPDSALVVETDPAETTPATAPATAVTTPPVTTLTPTPAPTTTTAPAPPPTNAPSNPPPTDAPVDTEPVTPAPTFNSFAATNVSACAAPDVSVPTIARMVTLTWDIQDADSIYVAVANVDGVYEGDLPATGSLELFVPCPDTQTYYVVAENASGRTVMEATR